MANLWILNQFLKGNKSCITDASVIKLNKNSCVTTRHNCFEFHKVPLYCCLVMTRFVAFKAIIMMIHIYYYKRKNHSRCAPFADRTQKTILSSDGV